MTKLNFIRLIPNGLKLKKILSWFISFDLSTTITYF